MKNLRLAYPLAFALVASLLAILVFSVVPAWNPYLGGSGNTGFLRSIVAAPGLAALYLISGDWLLDHRITPASDRFGTPGNTRRSAEFVDPFSREASVLEYLPVRNVILGVCAAAVVIGVARVLVQKSGITPPLPADLIFVVLLIATAVFEEVLFRGLLFEGFAKTLRESNPTRALLMGAVASSLLFGILHVTSDLGSLFRLTAYIQAAVKVVEGTLFGLIMCALYTRLRNVWVPVMVHFVFNLISEGPIFLATGVQTSTYITGSPADIAVLLAGTVILVLPAKWALDYFSH